MSYHKFPWKYLWSNQEKNHHPKKHGMYIYIYQSRASWFSGKNNRVLWAQRGAEVIARDLAFLSKYFGKYTWPSDFGSFCPCFWRHPRTSMFQHEKNNWFFGMGFSSRSCIASLSLKLDISQCFTWKLSISYVIHVHGSETIAGGFRDPLQDSLGMSQVPSKG